jgi:hypothetical protein
MSKHHFPIRRSLLTALLASLLAPHSPAQAYSTGEAWDWLGQAGRALANPSPNNCANADRFLFEADVHIDQVLRERTLNRNCTTQPLGDLNRLAMSLSTLNQTILTECGLRRNYDNTLGKIQSWMSAPVCGPPDPVQRCQEYASAAVRANQRNIEKRCGYTGEHWHSDAATHYNWCVRKSDWDAHQESQGRKILLDNCDAQGDLGVGFVGNWAWFNGGAVQIRPNGTFVAAGTSGTWRSVGGNVIELRWNDGGWIDTLSLSPDGNQLSGSNQHGGPVSASRVQVTADKAMLYDIETPPYGGGRVCLTAEEAERIRNEPNTVKFTPVGQPCSK